MGKHKNLNRAMERTGLLSLASGIALQVSGCFIASNYQGENPYTKDEQVQAYVRLNGLKDILTNPGEQKFHSVDLSGLPSELEGDLINYLKSTEATNKEDIRKKIDSSLSAKISEIQNTYSVLGYVNHKEEIKPEVDRLFSESWSFLELGALGLLASFIFRIYREAFNLD